MKIYDISQEIFNCVVYPGDTAPKAKKVRRTDKGDTYNLTDITMCVHNGTHIDAPFHFLGDGKTVDMIPIEKTVGICYVAEFCGKLGADDALTILNMAGNEAGRRILIKGDVIVTREAANVFSGYSIDLIGVESQSVGEPSGPMEVHKIFLEKDVVILEGLRLDAVEAGEYFLNATPINFGGIDGAPCRAILIRK